LTVATTLVNACRIVVEQFREDVRSVEARRGARVRNRAGGNQSVGDNPPRTVKRVKSAGPPAALSVRVGAELEEGLDQLEVAIPRDRDKRGRIEAEQRLVDCGPRLGVVRQDSTQCDRIAALHRVLEQIDWSLWRR
jgi:hypothetical protein